MGLRETNKQDKRERLSRAARELFSEQGFDDTTMRQIAERAGIGVGTIFLYAPDKQGLLFLLFSDAVLDVQRQAFASLPTQISDAAVRPSTGLPVGAGAAGLLLEQLVHIFSSFYRYYEADRRLSRLFIKELLFLDRGAEGGDVRVRTESDGTGTASGVVSDAEKHTALTLEFIGRLSGLVQQAQARGELRSDFDPLLATMNFFATYFLTLVGLLDPIHGAHQNAELATQRLRLALQLQISGLRSDVGLAREVPPEQERPRRRNASAHPAVPRSRRTRS